SPETGLAASSRAVGAGQGIAPFLARTPGCSSSGHAGVHGKVNQMLRKNHKSRLALAIVAACGCAASFAQDELDETIVTATRTPVKLDALHRPGVGRTPQGIAC